MTSMRTFGLLGIFVNPISTLAHASTRGAWLSPFLGMLVIAVLANAAVVEMVGIHAFARQAAGDEHRAEELTEQVENSSLARSLIYAGAAIAPAGTVWGVAGVFVALSLIVGLPLTPRQILTVSAYAFFVYFSVTGVLAAVSASFASNPADFDVARPLVSNLGDLLDSDTNPVLRSLASSFDVFSAVAITLLAVGFSAASGALSPMASWGMVLGSWVVYVALKAAYAAIG